MLLRRTTGIQAMEIYAICCGVFRLTVFYTARETVVSCIVYLQRVLSIQALGVLVYPLELRISR